ncbi:MAG: alpha/beta hydrolase [Rhodospirillales bacterium]|nr:alpha/beta hydrolase [Rhodospirillales bacterium]
METPVKFQSDGLQLAGIVHVPDGLKKGEKRPGMIVLHGFGGNKDRPGSINQAEMFCNWGYVTLRFDMRGLGESEGTPRRVICMEQVADTKNALTWLAEHEHVDGERVGLSGTSFGAAVAVYTGGVDERVAAVISSGGWGDGARKFRGQHPTPEAWAKFTNMLAEGKRHRQGTGESLMVPRWDIVPIPEHLRKHQPTGAADEFPAETAQSMYDFKADDVVGNIAPRPLLLFHPSDDSVTPASETAELFKRAGRPTDCHFLAKVDHFVFSESDARVTHMIDDWLEKYFPV